ncbi:hypothetical protein ACFWZ2_13355 [Streptomyces sp. NPDC059002]
MRKHMAEWCRRLGRRDLTLIVIASFVSAVAAKLVDATLPLL